MADYINTGIEKHYYFNPQPANSANGLFIVRMGETFPVSSYYIERSKAVLRSLGGVFVFEYLISGEGYIECDGECVHVTAGDFYFLNRGFSHRYYSEKSNPMHKIWINVAGPLVAGIAEALSITGGVFVARIDAENLFRRMQNLLSTIDYTNRDRVYDRVALALAELLLSASSARRVHDYRNEGIISEIKRYMDSEVNLRTTLDEICARFYQNKSYLIYRFRREYGVTPHKYLLSRKMDAARDMLATSRIQIKEMSAMLGFANPQYFSSAFRAATGMTPLEYREKSLLPETVDRKPIKKGE